MYLEYTTDGSDGLPPEVRSWMAGIAPRKTT